MGSRNMTLIRRSSLVIPNYVVGDNGQMFGQTLSVLDSIMLLIAIYYVFDLEYPTMYVHMVGIIQHWVVGDDYTEQKWSNSIKFPDMLSKSSDKPLISE